LKTFWDGSELVVFSLYQSINAICEIESSQANENTKLNNTIVMQQ